MAVGGRHRWARESSECRLTLLVGARIQVTVGGRYRRARETNGFWLRFSPIENSTFFTKPEHFDYKAFFMTRRVSWACRTNCNQNQPWGNRCFPRTIYAPCLLNIIRFSFIGFDTQRVALAGKLLVSKLV